MIAKIYWCEEHHATSGERLVTRQEEVVPFQTREWLDKQLMLFKMEGRLAGYEIYDYATQSDLMEAISNPRRWEEVQEKKIDSWYDRDAMAKSLPNKMKPGFNARTFM